MLRRKNDLPTKRSETAKQEKVLSTLSVEFELSDEELEEASGGVQAVTTLPTGTTVVSTATCTLTEGGRAR
jgi:hypothetical protein